MPPGSDKRKTHCRADRNNAGGVLAEFKRIEYFFRSRFTCFARFWECVTDAKRLSALIIRKIKKVSPMVVIFIYWVLPWLPSFGYNIPLFKIRWGSVKRKLVSDSNTRSQSTSMIGNMWFLVPTSYGYWLTKVTK